MAEEAASTPEPAVDPADAGVRAQYEAYPYPPRRAEDEDHRLILGSPSHLDELAHYCFGGRLPRPLSETRPFRALFAGGGTGDGLIMLAQQLAWRGLQAEITYLDLSAASRTVAEARARRRGLRNIRFLTGSLLDLHRIAPGPYDYIDCCGVLHHMPDPPAGLKALTAELAPGGGLGLMVYGALGRTGVYPLQAALKSLTAGLPMTEKIAAARRLLGALPETNWFRRNPFLGDHQRGEARQGEDAALYDLLLHERDRAYSVSELAELLDGAGLRPAAWIEPVQYDPASWIEDEILLARARALPPLEQAALAENLAGCLKTHVLYAVHSRNPVRPPEAAPAAVPALREGDGPGLSRALAAARSKGGYLEIAIEGRAIRLKIGPGAVELAARLDGTSSLDSVGRKLGWDWPRTEAAWGSLAAVLAPLNLLFLRV